MFNDKELLVQFNKGVFPKIHDNIFKRIISLEHKGTILDLCCCYGLLAERLNMHGLKTIGVERDYTYIHSAKKRNISTNIYNVDVLKQMKELTRIISLNNCTTLVLRRCLPELFGDDTNAGYSFFEEMYNLNIDTLIIEGRIYSKRTTNKVGDINREINLCISYFNLVNLSNNIAVLTRK